MGNKTRATKVAENYVNLLADESKPLASVKGNIITEARSDKTLQAVINAVQIGRWTHTDVKPYFNVRNELSVTKDGSSMRLSHLQASLSTRSIDATNSLTKNNRRSQRQNHLSVRKYGFPV